MSDDYTRWEDGRVVGGTEGITVAQEGDGGAERGDLLIADRFVTECGQDFRYTPGVGWLHWDGAVWRPCALGEHLEAVKGVARRMIAAAVDDDLDGRTAWAAMQEPRVRGALRLAEVDPKVAVGVARLDAEPHLLGTPGGVVELRTGQLRPAMRADLLTKCAAVTPAEAVSGEWAAFLARVQPDPEVRGFLQRLAGMAVVGRVREHLLPVHHGAGANGKSVFTTALNLVLGDHAHTAPLDLLLSSGRRPGTATPEVADLRGRRLVLVSESREDARLAVERVKALTGGDEVTARPLYGQPITFRPSHTVWLVTNHRPRIEDDGHAIWRRVVLVPWTVTIPEHEQTPDLAERLAQKDGAGVLRWVVDGARDYLAGGLRAPKSIAAASADYRDREDWFGAWLGERTEEHEGATVRAGALMGDYRAWAAEHGAPVLRDAAMRERLEARGFRRVKRRETSGGGRVSWLGLRLTEEGWRGEVAEGTDTEHLLPEGGSA